MTPLSQPFQFIFFHVDENSISAVTTKISAKKTHGRGKKEKKIRLALPVRDRFKFVLAAPSKTTKGGFDLASTLETMEGGLKTRAKCDQIPYLY